MGCEFIKVGDTLVNLCHVIHAKVCEDGAVNVAMAGGNSLKFQGDDAAAFCCSLTKHKQPCEPVTVANPFDSVE